MDKRRLSALTLFLCLSLLVSSSVQASSPDAATQNQLANTNSRQFSFEGKELIEQSFVSLSSGASEVMLPMDLPPGMNGFHPELSLKYNSQRAKENSPFGHGWELNLANIHRFNKDGINEMYTKPVYMSEVPGNSGELVKLSESADIEVYGLRSESGFANFSLDTSTNTWTVNTTDGKEYVLGGGTNSRLQNSDASKVYAWYVDSVEELHGNTIEYSYLKIDGTVYPKMIEYGSTFAGSHPFEVRFQPFYDSSNPASNRNDNRKEFRTGFGVVYNHVVDEVQVIVNGTERLSYDLTYINDAIDSRSFLKTMTTAGTNLASQTVQQEITLSYFAKNDGYTGDIFHRANLLRSVEFPKQGKITYEYHPSTMFFDGAGNRANLRPHYPVALVKQVTKTDPAGRNDSWNYHYEDGHFYYESPNDRQLAGFGRVDVTNPLDEETTYYFHQGGGFNGASIGEMNDHWSLIGRPYRVEIYTDSGTLVKKAFTRWDPEDIGNGQFFPQKSVEIETLIGLGSSSDKSTAIGFVYNDTNGNLESITEYGEVNSTNAGTFTDSGSDSRKTTYSYAVNGTDHLSAFQSVVEVRDHNANLINKIEQYYDDSVLGQVSTGNLTQVKQSLLEESRQIVVDQDYNSAGQITKMTDDLGNETTFSYASGALYPQSTTNELLQTTSFTYDIMFGEVISMTDPNGLKTEKLFDGFGRVIEEKTTNPDTSLQITTSETTYQESTFPHSIEKKVYVDTTNKKSVITYVDGFGRALQTREEANATQYRVVNTTHDSLDRKVTTSLPVFASGSGYNLSHGSSKLTTTNYDALHRIVSVVDSIGTTTYSYDERDKTITDAEGNMKTITIDAFDRIIQVEEVLNSQSLTTSYEYDSLDRMIKLTDANGNIRNFVYDSLGRLTEQEDLHDSADVTFGVWSYDYDDNGNVTKITNPKSEDILYTYDALNRLATEQKSGDTSTLITYNYDSGTNGIGRLTSVDKTDADWSGTYDKKGRLISETQEVSGTNYTKTYDYAPYDFVEEVSYPNSKDVQFGYDVVGNLVDLDHDTVSIIDTLVYAAGGSLAEINYGNGVDSVFTYDVNKQYRLTNKQSTITGGTPSTLQNINYAYDNVGNITNVTEQASTAATRNVDYTYDDLYRLTKADNTTASEIRTYSYDNIGNILSKSDQGDYSYDETGKTNPQAVTEIDVSSVTYKRFTYDDNGNLTDLEEDVTGGTISSDFTWDHHNRLIQSAVTDTSSVTTTTTYLYSADGKRLKKVVNDGTTTETTLYPFADYEVTDSNSQKVSVSAGNILVAVIETDTSGTEVYYHHNDHLGGSNIVTDDTGSLIQVVDYQPFGEVRANSQSATYDSTQKFTGHELDDATGLYYAQARYYDPLIGRFISEDPLQYRPEELMKKFAAQPQALNHYSYVSNNPVVYIDPTGLLRVKKGQATDIHVQEFNSSLKRLVNDVKNNEKIQNYYSEVYGVDLINALTNDDSGPKVTILSDRYDDFRKEFIPGAEYFGDGLAWTDHIELFSTVYDNNFVGMALIHEIEHWANDKASWWGDLNPNIDDFLTAEQQSMAEKQGGLGKWGGNHPKYGYASEIILYGKIIDQLSNETY